MNPLPLLAGNPVLLALVKWTALLGLDVIHPDLVVPLDPEMTDRWVRFKLTPGLTTELAVKLVPKGTDFRGAMR